MRLRQQPERGYAGLARTVPVEAGAAYEVPLVASGAWYVNVSDARPATVGSMVYGMDVAGTGASPRPLGLDR